MKEKGNSHQVVLTQGHYNESIITTYFKEGKRELSLKFTFVYI